MNNVIPMFTPESADFRDYIAATEAQAKVLPASAWRDELIASTEAAAEMSGATLPWQKTHDLIRLRPGELSMWVGINGHGKSQVLGQVSIGLAAQDEPVCLASFEMKPKVTLQRMLRQTARCENPSAHAAGRLVDWLDGRYWFYDQQGTVRPDQVYKIAAYAAERLGCKHIIIDSLMKCVRGEEDKDGQKNFVDELTALARDLNVHVHLVHHSRKTESEDKRPGKFDARGSVATADQTDNLFIVWRNKPKERMVEKLLRQGKDIDDATASMPDCVLACEKQRNGEWEGTVSLWFHKASMQYTPDRRNLPMELIGGLV